MRILVAGMVAAEPYQGGATWAALQYALGFEELGHEVWLVDPAKPTDVAGEYFSRLGLGERASLGSYRGPVPDVLVNLSGLLRDERVFGETPFRLYLDLDPVFTQLWHAQGVDVGLDGHTHYVTVGQRVPDTGHDWISTLPPVVLERWPVVTRVELDALTTVGNFRSYGTLEHGGIRYGQRAHSLRRLVELPALTSERLVLALGIDPDEPDLAMLRRHGWTLVDPRRVAGTPELYASFVRGSKAELGIAKEGYVVSRSGWFSDRSAVYLASGRPVVAQDTGFGERLPTGAGLLAFADADGALAAIAALASDYGRHARAARAIAEEHLDARLVLTRLLREVGALPPARRRTIYDVPEEEVARLLGARSVSRRPFAYRSSAPIAELDADGCRLLLKDLSPEALLPAARAARPDFLGDPRRELEVYRRLLDDAELGTPRLVATVLDAERERYWLVVERVQAAELYQTGERRLWEAALRWLARCHDRFAGLAPTAFLVRYDAAFFARWPARAGIALDGYDRVVARLARLPTTLVHGDLYPSNVLVSDDRVCVVDWERAGVGPGVLDVAALTAGVADDEAAELVEAYRRALVDPPDPGRFEADLACARLHLAVQWLGWSSDWKPPPEHAFDWSAELPRLAARAGLPAVPATSLATSHPGS